MHFRVWILLAALFMGVACDNDGRIADPPDARQDTQSPRQDREAEEAALWLSGELHAPQALYETIRDDLAAIRGEYVDSIPKLSIGFWPPWVVTEVLVQLTDDARDRFLAREPNDIDSLNVIFRASHLDTFRLNVEPYWTVIEFAGRLHPERLGAIYGAQDDVVWGEPNGYCCDWDNVYPWQHDGRMTYLFRDGYGDCPAGCIFSTFWYFRREGGVTEYVGAYSVENDPGPPDWWDEAKTAFYRFRGYE